MGINSKLLAFQKLGITVERDAANPFFKSRYTSLNQVLEKVKKPLNDAGVLIVQRAGNLEGPEPFTGIWTELIDTEDDSKVSSFVPFVAATDMQKLGSSISYARRYALISLLCLEDSDDDGESAISPRKEGKGVGDMTKEPDFNL